jgi:hypothetical protein
MGHAKEIALRQDAQGWSYTEGHVCASCVNDYALQAEIEAASEADACCSFCGGSPAAEVDVLLAAFVDGLTSEYGDANDEGVIYESREGGFQWGRQWDTYDLIGDEFWDVFANEHLLEVVQGAVHERAWVERNFAWPRRDEALSDGWERFCHAVKHETRYVFWLRKDPDEDTAGYTGDVPASRILYELGELVVELDLIHELPAGYPLWRARTHEQQFSEWGASDLGTVPLDRASKANRMSPAGIALFYGSGDFDTAVAEVAERSDDDWVTGGRFETSRACRVVNFTKLEDPPSIFDGRNRHRRRPLIFLHHLVEELRKPARETWEQLDYVPTQVVTEFLLRIFLDGRAVVGLLYPSAQTGVVSAVLDVPNERCMEQQADWASQDDIVLGLVPGSIETRRLHRRPTASGTR